MSQIPRVIIGTSGSPDYLRDSTADQRYWSMPEVAPVDGEARCAGIHDEGAPEMYLCTCCFPYGCRPDDDDEEGDLVGSDDHQTDPEEIA